VWVPPGEFWMGIDDPEFPDAGPRHRAYVDGFWMDRTEVTNAQFEKFVRATGNIPENINFAIKTGAIRDFLDNSVVPYQTAEPKGDLKTTDIAGAARAYTLLISCTATEQAESAKR